MYFEELRSRPNEKIERIGTDLIRFTNNRIHLITEKYKNILFRFDFGEIKIIEKEDYWTISFVADMKRVLVFIAAIFLFIFIMNFIGLKNFYLSLQNSISISFVIFIYLFATAKPRIKFFLDKTKNSLETWGKNKRKLNS